MKQMGPRVLALAAGFAGAWLTHDVRADGGAPLPMAADRPSRVEATAAVRRAKCGFLEITVTKVEPGDRAPSQDGRGMRWLPDIVSDPGTAPKSGEIAFARAAHRWEVA